MKQKLFLWKNIHLKSLGGRKGGSLCPERSAPGGSGRGDCPLVTSRSLSWLPNQYQSGDVTGGEWWQFTSSVPKRCRVPQVASSSSHGFLQKSVFCFHKFIVIIMTIRTSWTFQCFFWQGQSDRKKETKTIIWVVTNLQFKLFVIHTTSKKRPPSIPERLEVIKYSLILV